MDAGNVSRIIRAPGRIIIGPTNLAAADPYGGTEVGKSNLCTLQSHGTPFRVESEALGEATDILEANKRFVFACFIRGWDDDAVNAPVHDFYRDTRKTLEGSWLRPRHNGYMGFQDAAANRLNAGLLSDEAPEVTVAALNALYRESL